MHSFEHDTDASRTVFGTGTLSRVADELRRMGGRRALVLSTPVSGVSRAGGRRAG